MSFIFKVCKIVIYIYIYISKQAVLYIFISSIFIVNVSLKYTCIKQIHVVVCQRSKVLYIALWIQCLCKNVNLVSSMQYTNLIVVCQWVKNDVLTCSFGVCDGQESCDDVNCIWSGQPNKCVNWPSKEVLMSHLTLKYLIMLFYLCCQ